MRKSQRVTQLAIFIVGLGLRVALIAGDSATLVRVIPDDAFYYFETARNVAAGHGSTFDGQYATNGYHPLWLLSLLPMAGVSEPLSFVRGALALGCLLNVLSACLLWKSLRRISPAGWLPVAIIGLYFLAPRVMANSLNGLETDLATALFAAAFYVVVVKTGSSKKYEAGLGVLLGLMFLARTDTAFYAAVFWLIAVARADRSARWRRGLIALGAAGATIAPWLIWNWINFGSPMQVSGLAVPFVIREINLANGQTPQDFAITGAQLFALFPFFNEVYGWFAIAGLVALWSVRRAGHRLTYAANGQLRPWLASVMLLWLSGTALIFAHTFIRRFPRDWYFDQLNWLSAMTALLVLSVMGVSGVWRHRRARLLGGAVFIGLAVVAWVPGNRELFTAGVYPHQIEDLDAARWLKANTRATETSAAFNAGIIAYFSDRRVVNLDGVMNNAAFDAIQARRLWDFMRRAGVSYYLDYDPLMLAMYAPFMGDSTHLIDRSLIHVIDRPGIAWQGSQLKIYRLNWRQ